jgi:hypothetical protein
VAVVFEIGLNNCKWEVQCWSLEVKACMWEEILLDIVVCSRRVSTMYITHP